jgi:hypothetical protein
MTWSWLRTLRVLRILIVTAGVALGGSSCKHGDSTPPVVTTPPPPAMTGTVDCSSSTTWSTTSFAALVPSVQRAVAQSDAQGALDQLLLTHTNGEVACVAGYVHDQSVQQATAAPSDPLPGKRVTATQAWLAQQAQKGLTVKAQTATATSNVKQEAH